VLAFLLRIYRLDHLRFWSQQPTAISPRGSRATGAA
jgi:hypothetical protein